jgi:hypothetical protein
LPCSTRNIMRSLSMSDTFPDWVSAPILGFVPARGEKT